MSDNSVFFTPWTSGGNMLEKAEKLYLKSGILDAVQAGDIVAVKLHVGELGNPNYIRPFFVKQVLDLIREKGGKPFLTDTSTLYPLKRTNALDHMETAVANGFGFAPFIVADGLKSENTVSVGTGDPLLPEVEVAGAVHQADAMIVLSHVKGHPLSGFGGAVKNLAMGCVGKKSKLEQHRLVDLVLDEGLCQGCETCVEACWLGLPRMEGNVAVIDSPYCMRCPICSSSCPEGAITLHNLERLSQGLAVTAKAVASTFDPDKTAYVNFATEISTVCDCAPIEGRMVGANQGIVAGFSLLAVEAASLARIDHQALYQEHKVDCWTQLRKLAELEGGSGLEPEVYEV
ncbi:MAG: DUF362 domain-containing protein [Desulfurivibrionaceae bacterium]